MERYEKYKDSGIEWISEIPEKWEVKKIKHRCYVKGRVGWKGLKSSEFLTDGFSYLVTGTDFKNDTVDWENCYHIDEDRYNEDPYIQLQNEDLLITKDGTIGKLAVVTNLNKPACLNSGIFVVRSTKDDFTTRFLLWVLKSSTFTDFNGLTAYGSTIQHLYQNVFVEFAFAFPPVDTQISIANYLQKKITEIDHIIANKQKLIALYEEEKQAIINQAVTKGVKTHGVRLKDSGVEWLGEIPEHWEVKKLKYLVTLITEKAIGENSKIGLENIDSKTGKYIETNTEFEGEGIAFIHNDILYGKLRPYLAKVWVAEFEGAAVGDFFVIRMNLNLCSDFMKYRLLSTSFTDVSNGSTFGAKMPRVSWEFMSDLFFAIPSIDEQQSIVSHIEKECARLDAIIEKYNKQIDLLQEYRTTLISEVVTGKIMVPENENK